MVKKAAKGFTNVLIAGDVYICDNCHKIEIIRFSAESSYICRSKDGCGDTVRHLCSLENIGVLGTLSQCYECKSKFICITHKPLVRKNGKLHTHNKAQLRRDD